MKRSGFVKHLRVPRAYSVESSSQPLGDAATTTWSKLVRFHKDNFPVMASGAAVLTGVAGAGKGTIHAFKEPIH